MTTPAADAPMERTIGFWQATALNVTNMVGAGPFATIPLFLAQMNGPQGMIAWVLAALLVYCDGMVWSELGAAMPGSGGTYHFLRQTYGDASWRGMPLGRLLPFLFIWQFLFAGAAELASGYVLALGFVAFMFPDFEPWLVEHHVPGGANGVAAACALVVSWLLCRRMRTLGWASLLLGIVALATVLLTIALAVPKFQLARIDFDRGAWDLNPTFFFGLGMAMSVAIYDYLGYYNVCHLGDEVVEPSKTIPRAVGTSIVVVAALYLCMNVALIGVVPWREAVVEKSAPWNNIAGYMIEQNYGRQAAVGFTCLLVATAFACVFTMTLGYSRIPYAAARNGDFFAVFGRLHPEKGYPAWALWAIGIQSALFCFLPFKQIVDMAVLFRIPVMFLPQILAVTWLRRRPGFQMPFRMWLYPIPSLIATFGWLFLLGTGDRLPLMLAGGLLAAGVVAFAIRLAFSPSRPNHPSPP